MSPKRENSLRYSLHNKHISKALKLALIVLFLTGAWSVQYLVVVPVLFLFEGLKFGLRVGLIGFLLLCLPIVGWAILGLWLLLRTPPPSQPKPDRSYLKPWGIEMLRANAAV